MKNNIFKSFRFEIIMCSLLSLVYALLTESAIFFMAYLVKVLLKRVGQTQIHDKAFSMNSGILRSTVNNYTIPGVRRIQREGIGLFIAFSIILGVILFIIFFLILTKKFTTYLEEIVVGINEMSSGDFNTRIEVKNEDEFALIASRLNKMADDIRVLIENERKNEQAKNELITSVAHDLRTPLTSIIGYLDLASKEEDIDQETRQKYFRIAYSKSLRLEKLIEDLFNYTKFNTGEIKVRKSEIDMVKFMEQLIDEFYPSFQESGLEFDYFTNDTKAIVLADGDLLSRAFANLISNAVKYGRDGKTIRIKIIKSVEMVTISIINYGEVIPREDLGNIFDKFYRVETSRSRETGGSGLGLAIAKRIILMHDGIIRVTSDLDGTVFEVELSLVQEGKEKNNEVDIYEKDI